MVAVLGQELFILQLCSLLDTVTSETTTDRSERWIQVQLPGTLRELVREAGPFFAFGGRGILYVAVLQKTEESNSNVVAFTIEAPRGSSLAGDGAGCEAKAK
jgi:hypothetical protein